MKYAATTGVPVERSRAEIEGTLSRYGAAKFGYITDESKAVILFEVTGKRIRFTLPLPDKSDGEFNFKKWYRQTKRTNPEERQILWEQACRQRWRALALIIKAKLEWTETGIVLLEEEFMPYIVMPNGKTVAETIMPQIAQAYIDGKMPKMLVGLE